MDQRRRHKRVRANYRIHLDLPGEGGSPKRWSGTITNMSEGGVFVTLSPLPLFSLQMELDAQIVGPGWDKHMPPLGMRVVRIEEKGVALSFIEAEFPLYDSAYLPEPPAQRDFRG